MQGVWVPVGELGSRMPWGLAIKFKKKKLRNDISILRLGLGWRQHSSSPAFHHTHKPNFQSPTWKGEKASLSTPLSQKRFRKKQVLHGDQAVSLSFVVYTCSLFINIPKTVQAGYAGCTAFPFQACVEQTAASFWGRPQLSQMYSESHVLNPGRTSESPGAPT